MKSHNESQATFLPERLLRISEVEATTGLSKSTIYRLQRSGQFPKAAKLSVRTSAWSASAVNEWIAQRLAAGAAS